MILFKTEDNTIITDVDFRKCLKKFNLSGKSVLLFSRLFSFGRLQGEDAVHSIIEIIKDCIGTEGNLYIPAYTYSGYKGEVFDLYKEQETKDAAKAGAGASK